MKVLIAAPTCEEYTQRRLACLATWASTTLCDVKFYSARDMGVPPEADQVKTDYKGYLTVPGENLSYRVRELARWALADGYDYVFKCDDDTYVWVYRLLASGFERWDYCGFSHDWHTPRFASGGAGYWMSRRAMGVLAAQEDAFEPHDDVWVGAVMERDGIVLAHDSRYQPELPHVLRGDMITVHYVKDPETMRAIHNGGYPCEP